jgi:hypothetical protein
VGKTTTTGFLLAGVLVLGVSAAQAGQPAAPKKILKRTRSVMLGPRLKVQPGTWVSYIMTATPPKEAKMPKWEMRVKISLPIHADLEHPLKEGQYWMEMEFADPTMKKQDLYMALKMLLEGDPRDSKSLKRVFITAGNRNPMELPDKYIEEKTDEAPACYKADAKGCAAKGGKVRRFNEKKIYTKMGWIRATRVVVTHPGQKGRAEFWTSKQVPLFGLVRGSTPTGLALELEAFGEGALSRIDENKASPLPDLEQLEKHLKGMP